MFNNKIIKKLNQKNNSMNSKLNNIHTMLLEFIVQNPNIRNNDISNSNSNIRKWNITIQ